MRLTRNSSAEEFAKVLLSGVRFKTGGSLYGENGFAFFGRLSAEYHERVRNADYVVYSYKTPIAWLNSEEFGGQWECPDVSYSVTTKAHQNKIRAAIVLIEEK